MSGWLFMVAVGHVGLSNLLIAKMKIFTLLFVSFFSSFGMRFSLKPVRLGLLDSRNASSYSISGLVYLLNRQTVYVRNFSFTRLSGQDGATDHMDRGYFCANTSSGAFVIPMNNQNFFLSGSSFAHTELVLPVGKTVQELQWFGVCNDMAASIKLTSIVIHPTLLKNLPCNTTFLGSITTSNHGITGQVYLIDRLTYVILGFSYTHEENEDTVFWTGSGAPTIFGYHCTYENNIVTSLPTITNQDVVVNIPEDVGRNPLSYLAVWSRSSLVALSSVTFSENVFPPAPPPITAWYLGSFVQKAHNVQGRVYAVNDSTILLAGFHFDGNAPATYFRAIIGSSVFSREHAIIPDEGGSFEALGVYVNKTISLTLPENYTVQNIGYIAVWCYEFDINFGDANLNGVSRDLSQSRSVFVFPPLPHPDELCTPIPSQDIDEFNCKPLSDDITMSWIVNREQEEIVIELCGCVLTDNYIAFGLSGSDSGIQMVGSDVTWTWMNNEGVHAEELDINAYSQCQIQESNGAVIQTGVCPDTQNDVHSVSGYRDGCKTCIKYSRSLHPADSSDKSFQLDEDQWVIWSVGPVGSLQTSANELIPVPFKHYLRADYNQPLQVNFSRTPLNECQQRQCSGCDVQLTPWRQPELDLGDRFTVNARIGQSGGQKGYFGITGISGWGISWYLNGLLIPRVELYRGFEYTFIIEGGSDPSNPARYHPFYITSSDRGGLLVKSAEERKEETVYAGIDASGNPLGVGRYCEYRNKLRDRSNEFETFNDYKETLELFCLNGSSGQFTWTPDSNTPDIVYYQCASHQFLGWKMDIVDPPPELLPIEVYLTQGSPAIMGNNITVFMVLSKPPSKPVTFQLRSSRTRKYEVFQWDYQSSTTYLITLSALQPATYRIRLIAEGESGDRNVFRRGFTIPDNPLDCSPYLINNGIISDNGEVTVSFSSTGLYDAFTCQLDQAQPEPCDSPYVLRNLSHGEHRLRITPTECEGNSSKEVVKFSVHDNGAVVQLIEEVCPSVIPSTTSVVLPSTPQPVSTTHTSTTVNKIRGRNGSITTRTTTAVQVVLTATPQPTSATPTLNKIRDKNGSISTRTTFYLILNAASLATILILL